MGLDVYNLNEKFSCCIYQNRPCGQTVPNTSKWSAPIELNDHASVRSLFILYSLESKIYTHPWELNSSGIMLSLFLFCSPSNIIKSQLGGVSISNLYWMWLHLKKQVIGARWKNYSSNRGAWSNVLLYVSHHFYNIATAYIYIQDFIIAADFMDLGAIIKNKKWFKSRKPKKPILRY